MAVQAKSSNLVIPAKAGIQGKRRAVPLDPRFRGGDERLFRSEAIQL
jgi:hypothetical protein